MRRDAPCEVLSRETENPLPSVDGEGQSGGTKWPDLIGMPVSALPAIDGLR